MSEPDALKLLPKETQSKLRSTQILTSIPQIVSELLQNSLDANATRIDIGVDAQGWTCWVKDDGDGINKEELEKLGQKESGRYNTSKAYATGSINAASTFGFRGEALASAADIACLEICSRTSKSRNTWSVIIKGGMRLYQGAAVRWKRESSGTTVCIREAFYNLPVRRRSHPNPSRTWELVRREIETYALVFPQVYFSLIDTTNRENQTHSQNNAIVRIAKTSSSLNTFRLLYGHALTEHVEVIDFNSEYTKIEGFISLNGTSSRSYQFLYINRHPIAMSDLTRLIDSEFSCSSFGRNALDESGNKDLPHSMIRRSPRKSEKKPVYVLNISVPPEDVDNCMDPAKNVVEMRNRTSIFVCLRNVLRQFLEQRGFLSHENMPGRNSGLSPSPRKRTKAKHPNFDDSGYAEYDAVPEKSHVSLEDVPNTRPLISNPLFPSIDGLLQDIIWQDPFTKGQFIVDSQTGHSFCLSNSPVRQPASETLAASIVGPIKDGRRTLRLHNSRKPPEVPLVPQWLERALQKNEAYEVPENRIPSIRTLPNFLGPAAAFESSRQCEGQLQEIHSFPPSGMNSFYSGSDPLNFTKEDLARAKIIGQVDRKFIACQIHGSKRSTESSKSPELLPGVLVLVDQHAADERVRVERFLKEMCTGFNRVGRENLIEKEGPHIRRLVPPHPVLLTVHEVLKILQSQEVQRIFSEWGVRTVEVSDSASEAEGSEPGRSNSYSQLLVSSIPEVVADKLLQGNELRDFIQGFLAQILSGELRLDSRSDVLFEDDADEKAWLKTLRRCPKGLLDLVNSKACRGAIMFNDPLSMDQCRKLIQQLSETAFPFQCAHGRPSLLPLIETDSREREKVSSRRLGLRSAWKRLETMNEVSGRL